MQNGQKWPNGTFATNCVRTICNFSMRICVTGEGGRGGDDIWSHKPRGTQRIRITANRGDPLRVKLEGGSKLCSLMSITGSNTR